MANVYTVIGGTLSERPTTAEEGRIFWAYDTNEVYRFLRGAWVQQPGPYNLRELDNTQKTRLRTLVRATPNLTATEWNELFRLIVRFHQV